jgi:hypothetical protein
MGPSGPAGLLISLATIAAFSIIGHYLFGRFIAYLRRGSAPK